MSTAHSLVQATTPKRDGSARPISSPSTERLKVPDLVLQERNLVATPFGELGQSYFEHLDRVMDPSYRDPPLVRQTLARQPIQEVQARPATPLFLPDDGEIRELSGNPWYFRPPTPLPNKKPYLKRSPPSNNDDDEDEDIAYLGATVPLDGHINLGPPTRCQACGCSCGSLGAARSGSGSGSTTLSPRVLGEILHMLMGSGQSLLSTASRTIPGINSWADIAQRVGARREDFDRVRHAASGMQRTLPIKRSRGEL